MNNVNALELLSEARHYMYDFKNDANKDEVAFETTNEEEMILQELKLKYGYRLVNAGYKAVAFNDLENDSIENYDEYRYKRVNLEEVNE
ncbi:MAG TPA: hypothetical protein EYO73_07670 [Sulfurimonas sp.]|nr:hypothetical protein [Sulfurimonas sp.]